MGEEERRYTRLPFRAFVKYQDSNGIEYKTVTDDISEWGLFIQTDSPFPVGSLLSIEITFPPLLSKAISPLLPKEQRKGIKATVETVNVVGEQLPKTMPSGMGVKFTDISEEDREAIMTLISEVKGRLFPT